MEVMEIDGANRKTNTSSHLKNDSAVNYNYDKIQNGT